MKLKHILFLGVVSLVLTGCTLFTQSNVPNEDSVTDTTDTIPTDEVQPAPQASMEASVTVTNDGFTPKEVTIKKGGRVTWTNNSDSKVRVVSAFHPTHLEYPEFNDLTGMEKGETYSFTFERSGSWGYHNHLNPSRIGKVVVVE